MSNIDKLNRTPIAINLDKERHLKYTLNAFAEMEERYGSVEACLKEVEKNKMKAIIFIVWAGLMWEDDELTEKKIGNMIEISDLEHITEKLNEAITKNLPTKEETKTEDPNQ